MKLGEESHKKRTKQRIERANQNRGLMDKNEKEKAARSITEWTYNDYVKALYDENLDIKGILKKEWDEFVECFNKEKIESQCKEKELIAELDNWMKFFEPIKSTIPFENMRPQNKIIFSCTLILWKLLKRENTKEEVKNIEQRQWNDITKEMKLNTQEISENINKQLNELKVKIGKYKQENWRDAIVHDKRRFRNGVACIKINGKVIKKTVYCDTWFDNRGVRRYYYIESRGKLIGFRAWYNKNKDKVVNGKKEILSCLKQTHSRYSTQGGRTNTVKLE